MPPDPIRDVIEALKQLLPKDGPTTGRDVTAVAEEHPNSELGKDEVNARLAERRALMKELNKRHAVIENYGGKCVVACWDPSPIDPSRPTLTFQSFDAFRQRYSNQFVKPLRANHSPKVLGSFWLSYPWRRQYRGVTFQPAGPPVVNDCLNTWKGWGVEPKQGDWSGLQQHIREVIANNDEQAYKYIIRWIAWAIQHPDRQAEVALVLMGEKSTGKGTLIRCLETIFGAHTFQVSSQEHVVGKFNAHHRDCILFIADEAYWAGDTRCLGALQRMITEPKLSVEPKSYVAGLTGTPTTILTDTHPIGRSLVRKPQAPRRLRIDKAPTMEQYKW
jgi:hypothetical protein